MKAPVSTLATLALLLPAAPTAAELCTIDAVPAATLLIPYFEVDLANQRKVNTVVSIQNTTSEATIAHVTLWTNWAVPTLNFDVFLTGYDIETIDLREIFVNGLLPQTAHAANDPDDDISPHGTGVSDNPSWDSVPDNQSAGRFSGCDQLLPPAPLPAALADRIRKGHTGRDTGEGCVAANLGDNYARGYITIDNATDCSLLFPGESGYFGSGGVASDVNQLRGDYYITERSGKGMAAAQAVAVEAESGVGAGYTFYGRYVNAMGTDHREPLATTWAVRWADRLPFGKSRRSVDTDLIIWRDTTHNGLIVTYECGVEVPPWFPFNETQIVAFDEQENATQICGFVDGGNGNPVDRTCAPLATQRVRLGRGEWQPGVNPGWYYLNLNTLLEVPGAVNFDGLAQSYVSSLTAIKRLRGNTPATALSSACDN